MSQGLPSVFASPDCICDIQTSHLTCEPSGLALKLDPIFLLSQTTRIKEDPFPTHKIAPWSTDKIEIYDSFLCVRYYYLFPAIVLCFVFKHPTPSPWGSLCLIFLSPCCWSFQLARTTPVGSIFPASQIAGRIWMAQTTHTVQLFPGDTLDPCFPQSAHRRKI